MSRDNKKNDLRVIRTHQQLEEAFRALSFRTDPDAFTIQQLCDEAGIRRTTFYQHFEDKHDFYIWFLLRIQRQYIEDHPLELKDTDDVVSVSMQCVTKMLGFLKENSRLINAISSDRLPKASFLGWFYVAYRESLKQHVKRYTDLKGILSLFPHDMIASYYTGAIVSSVIWWYSAIDIYKEQNFLEDLEQMLRHSPQFLEEHSLHINQ